MFTEEKDTFLQVMPNKFIKVTIVSSYFKNSVKIGEETWQCIVEPNKASIENAKTFLDDYYMNIVYNVFTDEVMEAYALSYQNEETIIE